MRTLLALVALWQAPSSTQQVWQFDNLERIGGHAVTVEGHPKVINAGKSKAIEFNGVDDALFLDTHPLAGAREFTWEVIFRPASGGRPEQRFFHLQEDGSQFRYLFETRLIGDQWCLDTFAASATGSKPLLDRTQLHPVDRWYHIAATYDGHELRHYINGELQGAGEVKLTPQSAGRTSVGVRINRVDYFKGAVRWARFTPRVLPVTEFTRP